MSPSTLTIRGPLPSNMNPGLSPATQATMLGLLGNPRDTFSHACQPVTNKLLKSLIVVDDVGPFRIQGLRPAIERLPTTVSVKEIDRTGQRDRPSKYFAEPLAPAPEHVFDSLGTHVEMPENSSFPLAKRGTYSPESHACDFGEGTGTTCITTSHGKSGRDVGNTIRRCSSPRRGDHRERPSGSAPIVRFASSASTMPFAATSGTGCGVG